MPKPVYFMTVQEVHKEYNSLMDRIRVKYEQLDSGEFGSPGTPAFDAEACELANLLACVSELCINWTCQLQRNSTDTGSSSTEEAFRSNYARQAVWLGYGGCSFVCRYVRITRLLSAPLDLRIGDWLCILPAITLVVVKSKNVNKAASSDWWTAEPSRQKAHTIAFPPGRGERPLCTEFSHLIVLCIRCCARATNTSVCIDSLYKHGIQCIACFDLHINSVDKQDTLLNSIALIFCINHHTCPLMYIQEIRW